METYFDKVIDSNYALDLMANLQVEFYIVGNKLPAEFEFQKFLSERKKEILEITNRLNDRENVFYIEKLKMDLKGDYGGIEAYFFKQIELENILSVVPEVREHDTFTLNAEQFEQIEKKYSLFPYFKRAQNEILAFIEQFNIKAPVIPPQQPEPETPSFQNNFDKVKPAEIYKHFKTGLVDKGYLTEWELRDYLKAAFELGTIPESLFKIKDAPSKERIYTVFYTYYLNVAGKPYKKQPHYIELLGNYFEGFSNQTIKTNWAKGYSPKKY